MPQPVNRPQAGCFCGATLAVALLTVSPTLTAAIYRCQSDGVPVYSQFCPPAQREELGNTDAGEFLQFAPLTEAERAALKALDSELSARRRAARARQDKQRQRARSDALRAERRCAAARSALTSLRRQLRKGYSAADASALKARERELTREQRVYC